ncbi:MAG: Neocarzinostatin family [Actinomycetota bacterium]|jgi:hypothetical protein|nr:Neocarzinostatin family [Actinomycetota bacterium]
MFADRSTRSIVTLAGGALVVVLGALLAGGVAPLSARAAPAPSAVPPAGIDGQEVHLQAEVGNAFESDPPRVDRLRNGSVLRISAAGFETFGRGYVEQCTVGGCSNLFPVLFDENGSARFQYLVVRSFATRQEPSSTCGAGDATCVVHLGGNGRSAYLTTVFGDAIAAPPRVTVSPRATDLVDGARVQLTVAGFAPGERVQAKVCAAPETHGSARCGGAGPVVWFEVDALGNGHTTFVVREGRVGSDKVLCGRDVQCGIVVAYQDSSLPAPVAPISFAGGPSARYNLTRSLAGLGGAFVLFALAFLLVRNTDWRKPTEADTPDLDQASFAEDDE